jgi:hypothetical protein
LHNKFFSGAFCGIFYVLFSAMGSGALLFSIKRPQRIINEGTNMKFSFSGLALAGLLATGTTSLFAVDQAASGLLLLVTPEPGGQTQSIPTLTNIGTTWSKNEIDDLVNAVNHGKSPYRASFDLAITETVPVPSDSGPTPLLAIVLAGNVTYQFDLVYWSSTTATAAPPAGDFTISADGIPSLNGNGGAYNICGYVAFQGKVEKGRGDAAPAYSVSLTPSVYAGSVEPSVYSDGTGLAGNGNGVQLTDTVLLDVCGPVTVFGSYFSNTIFGSF